MSNILSELKTKALTIENKTIMNFLKEHNGFRNSKLHLFIGSTGVGKSTLTRTVLLDFLGANTDKNAGLFLSEETHEDFLTEFSFTELPLEKIEKLKVVSESSMPSSMKILEKLDILIQEAELNIMFIDNITTVSEYESARPGQQNEIAKGIKALAVKYKIPIVVIAHSGGTVIQYAKALMDSNNIRGGKGIVNLAEFVYLIQSITINDQRKTILRISKSRGQNVKNQTHQLFYYPTARIFGKSESVDFSKLKELFKQMDTL